MRNCMQLIVGASFILLSFLQNAFSKPLQKETIKALFSSETDGSFLEPKQFIGTSVIGGLMWPVLLTLTFTAIMARIPDALQRLFGGGGSYRHTTLPSLKNEEYLNTIMRSLLTSIDAIEGYN